MRARQVRLTRSFGTRRQLIRGAVAVGTSRNMRLTGGLIGGRRLIAPRGSTRPTASRVREAMFNILGPPPDGSSICTPAVAPSAWRRCRAAPPPAVFVEREHAPRPRSGATSRSWGSGPRDRHRRRRPHGPPAPGRHGHALFVGLPRFPPTSRRRRACSPSSRAAPCSRPAPSSCSSTIGASPRPDRRQALPRGPPPVWRYGGVVLPVLGVVSLAVYPGTFDPITNGHVDIVERSLTSSTT